MIDMLLHRCFSRGMMVMVIAVLATAGGSTVGLTAEPAWKCGTAAVKITPEEPLWMAGYGGRNHPSEGTLHDLWVKALFLTTGDGHRAVVVTSDLLGFPKVTADAICRAAAERFGLRREEIMLTSSHTHSGPVLADSLGDIYPMNQAQHEAVARYARQLVPKVVDCIGRAVEQPTPASLGVGVGTTAFAVNRRNNKEAQVPQLRAANQPLAGPNDHAVPVLAVRSAEGSYRAVVFGYACHNTTLGFYQWCGDYAGFAQLALQKRHPQAQAMFTMGCGADQNPIPRRTVELAEKYGQMLSQAVDETLEKSLRPVAPRLRAAWAAIELPFHEQPTREELEKWAQKKDYQGRWAQRLLAEMPAGRPLARSYPAYPIQVWKLGSDQLWIALGGEVVVDYSLRFKKQYGPGTWVTGYANDVMAYIPSHRVWQEGRYEAGAFSVYGLPANRWCEDIEERISGCVERLVANVNR